MKEELSKNTIKKQRCLTLEKRGDIFELYEKYENYTSSQLASSTRYDIRTTMQDYVLPFFGKKNVKDITKLDILDWQNWLSNQKTHYGKRIISTCYKNKIRFLFQGFLSFVEEYWDIKNVLKGIKPFKDTRPPKTMDFYTYPEFLKFIKYADNIMWKCFFCMQYYMGFRFGESCALSDKDVDFENKVIHITKSVSRKSITSFNWYVKIPKNKSSIRDVMMPNILISLLKEYLQYKKQNKISSTFLFGGEIPLSNKIVKTKLNKYAKKAKLRAIRIHDLRHSNASFLIHYGANIMLVSKRLGHCSPNLTLRTYAKLFPNAETQMIKKINKLN